MEHSLNSSQKVFNRIEKLLNKEKSLLNISFYQSVFYSEICSKCGKDILYKNLFGDRGLTSNDYHVIECPHCGAKILPCDYCQDFHYSVPDCNKCVLKASL